MGPVIFITGNIQAGAVYLNHVDASMGPVIFITGNSGIAGGMRGGIRWLQWGR